ncbi:hypothetical protein Tco_1090715, partial [Tanacetum coccineum]
MTTSVVTNSVLRGFFEKQKLTGPNFIDWYRQIWIVLSVEDNLDYLEQPIPPAPVPAQAGQQVAPEALAGLMLMTMEPNIQRNLENLSAYDMLQELKTLFAQQAEQELLQTVRDFHFCKQEEGQSVSSYVLKMKSYIDNLERLGHPVSLGLAVSLILIGLRHWKRKLSQILSRSSKEEKEQQPSGGCGVHWSKASMKLKSGALTIRGKWSTSTRTRRPTDRMCLYIDAEEHELGDLELLGSLAIPRNYDYRIGKWMSKHLRTMDISNEETGYVFVLNGGVVDWKSAKQSIFATSSAEAECIAAFDASKEAVWVRKFIYGLGVVPTIEKPINMYCDNTRAIAIANESGITKGARHFCSKVHYHREVIEFGDIKLEKVHTYDNLADPFTKALAFPKHSELTRNIGMLPASSFM